MPDYQKLYTTLFNAVSDAIGALGQQNYGTALNILCKAQRTTEELYLSDTENGEPSKT